MEYKVFFAFQMDTEDKFGKGFIQSAIEIAIQKFKAEGINIILDFGFRKTPGTPLLIDEMLKKSQMADMVLVDLTFTSSKNWINSKKINLFNNEIRLKKSGEDKLSPNPNVLLETGYAWAQKGSYRTLAIMNTSFGDPNQLPVDLIGFRWGITYELNESNYENKKSVRKELSDNLYKAINDSINSETSYQREKWNPIRINGDWNHPNFRTKYFITDLAKVYFEKLKNTLSNPENPQRIVGPKDSGKTRLVFELFKYLTTDEPLYSDIDKVLYYDFDLGGLHTISDKLLDLRTLNQRKILILDNCSKKDHDLIYNNYLFDTPISLLSIGNEQEGDTGVILIDEAYPKQVIQEISNQHLSQARRDYVLNKSESKINQAKSLINIYRNEELPLPVDYNQKWQQSLGDELIENKGLQLLEELSMFSHIGFTNNYMHQSDFIIERLGFKDKDEYIDIVEQLISKDLISISGDFIVSKVFVEELAQKWLEQLVDSDISEFIVKITHFGLAKSFSKRLIELSKLDSTTPIFNELTKEGGLLTNFEFINTDEGARIIMSLAEVSHERTLKAIASVLMKKNTAELQLLLKGRRYLVWALERLCFRKETFKDAALILYKLALAENENIGNNATSQFSQLFQVYLAGTEAALIDRLALLEEILEAYIENDNYSVIIDALNKGLIVHGWMRMSGADKQADDILKDYIPKEESEKQEYWKKLIKTLVDINTEESRNLIKNKLSQHFRIGNRLAIIDAVEKVLETDKEIDKELRQQIAHIIEAKDSYDKESIEKLEEIVKIYSDDSVDSKLKILVAQAPYMTTQDGNGNHINLAELKAREFARVLVADEKNEWLGYLNVLLQGEQRQTFGFGNELGKIKSDFKELIAKSIEILTAIPSESQNNILIDGYLDDIKDEEFKRSVIDKYLEIPEISFHAIRLTKQLEINVEDLEKLKPVILANPNFPFSLQYIQINHLPVDEFTDFLNWLKNIEPSGWWLSIDMCHYYIEKNTEKLKLLHGFVCKLLMKKEILTTQATGPTSYHDYKELVEKLQADNGFCNELVIFLSEEIIRATNEVYFSNDYYLSEIITVLFENYWDLSWPIISQQLINKDYFGWFNLIIILKNYRSYDGDKLLNWMNQYPEEAPQHIIQIIDFSIKKEGQPAWNPLVIEMLDRFGTNTTLLNNLSAVLGTWSTSGSATELLTNRKNLVSELTNHNIIEVKEFAKRKVSDFETQIKREKNFIQNFNIEHG